MQNSLILLYFHKAYSFCFKLCENVNLAFSSLTQDTQLIFGKELANAENIAASYQKLNPVTKVSYISKTKMLPHLEAPEKFLSLL